MLPRNQKKSPTKTQSLKKNKIIDNYNKKGEVKINKVWYGFGNEIGGGIYPLTLRKGNQLHSFLFSINRKVIRSASGYQYIGAFYNNTLQAIRKGKVLWINKKARRVREVKDEYENYLGYSKIVRINKGKYQIIRNGVIVKGTEELENMAEFLRRRKDY